MRTVTATISTFVLAALALPTPGRTQESADGILAEVRHHYDQQVEHVQDYTLVQEVGGQRQILYFERREEDGHAEFAPVGPFAMMLESGDLPGPAGDLMSGNVLGALKGMMGQAAGKAGMDALQKQVQGMGDGVFADFIGPLLTPDRGQSPGEALGSLTDGDHLKHALLEGAKRAALHEAERALLNAAAPQLATLLQGLQSGGAQQMLDRMVDGIKQGELPTPSSAFNKGPGTTARGGPFVGGGGGLNGAFAAAGVLAGAAMARKAGDAAKEAMRASQAPMFDPKPYELAEELRGAAELTGRETIDGHDTWVLTVDDASKLEDVDTDDVRSPGLTLWVDRDLYVPRRMRMEGEVEMDGKWTSVTIETRHDDFHTVQGLVVPYRTSTSFSGMAQGIPEDKREQMQKKMEEMQKQLASMPPQQRAMAEKMMKSRMPQLQAMSGMSGEPVKTVVTEVRVNQGPPPELVEQAREMAKSVKATG